MPETDCNGGEQDYNYRQNKIAHEDLREGIRLDGPS